MTHSLRSLIVALLFVAAPLAARAQDTTPALATPLCLQVSPDFTLHPMLAVPVVGYSFVTHTVVPSFTLSGLYELDYKGLGGLALGGTTGWDSQSHYQLAVTAVASVHLPQLAGTPVSHVVVGYSRSVIGGPGVDQLVVGPAFAF